MARGERVSTLHASPDSTTRLMRGVALGLVAVLGLVGWARWQGLPSDAPTARVQQEVVLHFRDSADGSVEVKEATRGEPLARFTGEQGFLRGTLRALARERRRHGVDEAPPCYCAAMTTIAWFFLIRAPNYRLTWVHSAPVTKPSFLPLFPPLLGVHHEHPRPHPHH